MIKDSVQNYGPRTLFGTKKDGVWNWITYADFGKIVDDCRSGLVKAGMGAGDRSAIISNNRVEWAAAAYATYGLGGSFVPMYEAQQPKEWEFILKDSGAKVVFCASQVIAGQVKAMLGNLPDAKKVVCLDAPVSDPDSFQALLEVGKKNPSPAITPDPKSLAAFIYTSGTTGNPKGVLLTHSNVASNVSAAGSVLPLLEDDRTLSFLPWSALVRPGGRAAHDDLARRLDGDLRGRGQDHPEPRRGRNRPCSSRCRASSTVSMTACRSRLPGSPRSSRRSFATV